MKKSSILLAALFLVSTASLVPSTADAQARGTVKKSSKRTTTRTTRTPHTTRTHRHNGRTTHRTHGTHRTHSTHRTHGTHRTHRTHTRAGVHLHVGFPYGYYTYDHHYHPSYYRHSTIIYDRSPDVVIVEREPRFTMPALECPIRTEEERSGLQQWCATSRGTKHGMYRRWYDNGVLAAEGEYEYDVQTGVWVEYHANGTIREEGAYDDGARIGTWVTWGSDGEELVVVDY